MTRVSISSCIKRKRAYAVAVRARSLGSKRVHYPNQPCVNPVNEPPESDAGSQHSGSQQSGSQHSADRGEKQSCSQRSADRGSDQSCSQRSADHGADQSCSQRSADLGADSGSAFYPRRKHGNVGRKRPAPARTKT
jgi:hypothetical protein